MRLHHLPSGLIAKGEEDRSQHVNKRRALRRLRMTLATDLLGGCDPADYKMSGRTRSCINDGRLAVRLKDERALFVINEVLSLLHNCNGRVSDAAGAIGVSTGNLVKFFNIDPQVWRKVSHIRQANGLSTLKSET